MIHPVCWRWDETLPLLCLFETAGLTLLTVVVTGNGSSHFWLWLRSQQKHSLQIKQVHVSGCLCVSPPKENNPFPHASPPKWKSWRIHQEPVSVNQEVTVLSVECSHALFIWKFSSFYFENTSVSSQSSRVTRRFLLSRGLSLFCRIPVIKKACHFHDSSQYSNYSRFPGWRGLFMRITEGL